jgi:predicted ester cyclase
MTFVRFEDARIAEIWNIQDTATLQSQLQEAASSNGAVAE